MFIYSSSRFQLGVLCILARAYGQRAWPAILSWQRHRGHTILTLDEDETIYIQRRHRIKVYRGKWEVMEVSGWSLALWPVRKGRVRSDKISSLERGRGSGLLSSCCQSWSTTNEGYDLSWLRSVLCYNTAWAYVVFVYDAITLPYMHQNRRLIFDT